MTGWSTASDNSLSTVPRESSRSLMFLVCVRRYSVTYGTFKQSRIRSEGRRYQLLRATGPDGHRDADCQQHYYRDGYAAMPRPTSLVLLYLVQRSMQVVWIAIPPHGCGITVSANTKAVLTARSALSSAGICSREHHPCGVRGTVRTCRTSNGMEAGKRQTSCFIQSEHQVR